MPNLLSLPTDMIHFSCMRVRGMKLHKFVEIFCIVGTKILCKLLIFFVRNHIMFLIFSVYSN